MAEVAARAQSPSAAAGFIWLAAPAIPGQLAANLCAATGWPIQDCWRTDCLTALDILSARRAQAADVIELAARAISGFVFGGPAGAQAQQELLRWRGIELTRQHFDAPPDVRARMEEGNRPGLAYWRRRNRRGRKRKQKGK